MLGRARTLAIASLLAIAGWPSPASATYSIAAFDRATGRFGGATASCVPLEILNMVYASVPGEGAVLTQSYLLPNGAARAVALGALAEGQSAPEVLAELTDPTFDADFALRQYAVLDPAGGVAAFTGSMAEPFASDRHVSRASFEIVVAGNFLSGDDVLLAAIEAFDEGCDLEARLMNALRAASADGRGDARCVVDGAPAQSALIDVERTDAPLHLAVDLPSPPPDDPVALLAEAFDSWRTTHPCPAPAPPKATAPPDADHGGCAASGSPPHGWGWLALLSFFLTARRRREARSADRHPSFE